MTSCAKAQGCGLAFKASRLLLAALIALGLPTWPQEARAEVPAPVPADPALTPFSPALVAQLNQAGLDLESALASGDAARATAAFLDRSGPCYRWVSDRWAEARRGLRQPTAWAVRVSPYALHENMALVRLELWLHDEKAPPIQAAFDVRLRRLGSQWRVAEALDLDRPECRLEGLELAAQQEAAGGYTLAATLRIRPTGPDRHLYFSLPERATLVAVRLGSVRAAASRAGSILHVELPAGLGPFALTVGYRLASLGADPVWWPKPLGLELEGPVRAAMHPLGGELGLASGLGQPLKGVEVGLLHGAWAPALAMADPMGTLSAHLLPEHMPIAPMLLAELAEARKQLAEAFGKPAQAEPWAIAEAEGADGSAGAGLLALPAAWLNEPPLAAGGVMAGACRTWLAREAVLGSPAERALLTEGLANYLSLALHQIRDGQEAQRADLAELARRLAAQPRALASTPLAELDPNNPPPGSSEAQAHQALRARGALLWAMVAQATGGQKLRQALAEPGPRSLNGLDLALKRLGANNGLVPLQAWMEAPMPMPWAVESLRTVRKGPNRYEVQGTFRLDGPTVPMELPLILATVDGQKRRFGVRLVGPRTDFALPAVKLPTALYVDPLHESPLASGEALPVEPPAP